MGIAEHRGVPGLTGLSALSAPPMSIQALAMAGQVRNNQIMVTTVRSLWEIGVRLQPSPGQGFHVTVVTPIPLNTDLATKISSVFVPMPNPARVP